MPNPPSGDTIPPIVNNVNIASANTIEVYYSESVDTTAENVNNYSGLGVLLSAVRNANGDMVSITLSTPLSDGLLNTLIVNNVKDTSGNTMLNAQSFDLVYNSSIVNLVITEIMYNDPTGLDSLEYFEVYNNSDTAVNISAYKVTQGVDYIFPVNTILQPYEFLAVANDSALVNSVFMISGTQQWTSGGLKNSGEDIEIQNTVGDIIDYVDYDDANPWPVEADGYGYSLELKCENCNNDNNIGSNWMILDAFFSIFDGDTIYGTPGKSNVYESIEENNSIVNVRIYPNPTSDILYMDIKEGSYKLQIFSVNGMLVKQIDISKLHNEINVKDFKSGLYLIKILNKESGDIGYSKFIIR